MADWIGIILMVGVVTGGFVYIAKTGWGLTKPNAKGELILLGVIAALILMIAISVVLGDPLSGSESVRLSEYIRKIHYSDEWTKEGISPHMSFVESTAIDMSDDGFSLAGDDAEGGFWDDLGYSEGCFGDLILHE